MSFDELFGQSLLQVLLHALYKYSVYCVLLVYGKLTLNFLIANVGVL